KIDAEEIKNVVSSYFSISVEDIEGGKRSQDYTIPRQIAMYLIRELTNLSLPQIGNLFGGRDHTTVLYSIDKIKRELKKDENLKAAVEEIRRMLIGD
ncbi:MAG TPA: chromosomal replication initiator protein DnaA, partial [Firmicutes bacterium]|nr:chromosomal replication initiator protein DnaA [Bacillota bacterium]